MSCIKLHPMSAARSKCRTGRERWQDSLSRRSGCLLQTAAILPFLRTSAIGCSRRPPACNPGRFPWCPLAAGCCHQARLCCCCCCLRRPQRQAQRPGTVTASLRLRPSWWRQTPAAGSACCRHRGRYGTVVGAVGVGGSALCARSCRFYAALKQLQRSRIGDVANKQRCARSPARMVKRETLPPPSCTGLRSAASILY